MILFGLFVLICMCIMHPEMILGFLSPFIVLILVILYEAIKNKIKYGYFMPWEHREELRKKEFDG